MALSGRNNLETVYNNRGSRGVYLSPEQCDALESRGAYSNPYKNDVWSMGLILLECGLLEDQSPLYKDDYARLDYPALQRNLQRFGAAQGHELQLVVELMLKPDTKDRPDWMDLEQYAKKSVNATTIVHTTGRAPDTTHSVFYTNNNQAREHSYNNNRVNERVDEREMRPQFNSVPMRVSSPPLPIYSTADSGPKHPFTQSSKKDHYFDTLPPHYRI